MRIFFSIIIIVASLQCTSKREALDHQANPIWGYEIKESIDLALGPELTYKLGFYRYINDTLIAYDKDKNKLDLYDLSTSQFIKSIVFQKDGENRIPLPDGVYIHNLDSIFCYKNDMQDVYLVDGRAELINKIKLPEFKFPESRVGTGGNQYFNPICYYQPELIEVPFYFNENGFYFLIMPSSNFSGTKSLQTFYSSPIVLNLSENTNESYSYLGKWPDDYRAAEYPNNPINNFAVTEDGIVISFYNNQQIYSSKKEDFFFAKSNFSRKKGVTTFESNSLNSDPEKEFEVFHLDEGYVNILYDPFQKLYYRVFKKEQHSISENSKVKQHKLEAEWSLLILDLDFNVKGEVLFPTKVYNYMNIIPTKRGLMISRENIYAKTYDEKTLSFDVIKFTEEASLNPNSN
jgi:hypothetical protein